MIKARKKIGFHLFFNGEFRLIILVAIFLSCIRWTKGAGYLDFYSILVKPILPGTAQSEWIKEGENIEKTFDCNYLKKIIFV